MHPLPAETISFTQVADDTQQQLTADSARLILLPPALRLRLRLWRQAKA